MPPLNNQTTGIYIMTMLDKMKILLRKSLLILNKHTGYKRERQLY